MVGDSHLVLSEGSGFVRADYLGAAECFNGCELADNRIFLGHVGNADGKNYRDNSRKSLGDGRNGKADGDHEYLKDCLENISGGARLKLVPIHEDCECKNENADAENKHSQNL